jgi:hypothetical protein
LLQFQLDVVEHQLAARRRLDRANRSTSHVR